MGARILLALAMISTGALQPRSLFSDVQASTDVPWLERLCNEPAVADAEYAARGRNTAGVKGVRSAAYVRLGELGTSDSLEAIARVEAAHRGQTVLPRVVVPGGWRHHPAPHMSDSRWQIENRLRLSQGLDATAFILDFYGPPALFIVTGREGRWGRPHLVLSGIPRYVTVSLREVGRDRLRAEFSTLRERRRLTEVPVVPEAIEFSLSEIEKDADGDGWTDVEEGWLETDMRATDTDRDGLPDGSDSTPAFESPRTQADPVEAAILRRALFALFGLTGAPHALFVRDQSYRLQLDNLPGPVFYRDARSGVRVTWKVVKRSDAEATVEIIDYEAPLAASGNEITLRHISGDWYVARIKMLWIS
jgi:hypothetical protein